VELNIRYNTLIPFKLRTHTYRLFSIIAYSVSLLLFTKIFHSLSEFHCLAPLFQSKQAFALLNYSLAVNLNRNYAFR